MDVQDTSASQPISYWPAFTLLVLYMIALADMPYGFYMIIRLATCGVSVWLIWQYFQAGESGRPMVWGLGAIAVLYNPILPIYLYSKELWTLVNVVTMTLVFVGIRKIRRQIST